MSEETPKTAGKRFVLNPSKGSEALDKFNKNEPLNDELANLRKGQEATAPLPPHTQQGTPQTSNRPLTRQELIDLAELKEMPGYRVIPRLVEIGYAARERSAIVTSHENPLARAQQIAEAWAILGMYKLAALDLVSQIEEAASRLKEETPGGIKK